MTWQENSCFPGNELISKQDKMCHFANTSLIQAGYQWSMYTNFVYNGKFFQVQGYFGVKTLQNQNALDAGTFCVGIYSYLWTVK